MKQLITGIHHITAIAGDPQANVDIYTGLLGMRLVKKTVNFDAPEVYHFYYGDENGAPGSILTFFPYGELVHGRAGKGMITTIAFSVPSAAKQYWKERLVKYDVAYTNAEKRFGDDVVSFEDHDGLKLELIFNDKDPRPGFSYGHIPVEFSLRGFYGATIESNDEENTISLLAEFMDHRLIGKEINRKRYAATDAPGNYIDLVSKANAPKGLPGNGTVHHIAFSTPSAESQVEIRMKIARAMLNPTGVLDRNYFTSVYFREPGGVLFEIATSGPGFAIDEEPGKLGEDLKLPSQFEKYRDSISRSLRPINLSYGKYP